MVFSVHVLQSINDFLMKNGKIKLGNVVFVRRYIKMSCVLYKRIETHHHQNHIFFSIGHASHIFFFFWWILVEIAPRSEFIFVCGVLVQCWYTWRKKLQHPDKNTGRPELRDQNNKQIIKIGTAAIKSSKFKMCMFSGVQLNGQPTMATDYKNEYIFFFHLRFFTIFWNGHGIHYAGIQHTAHTYLLFIS